MQNQTDEESAGSNEPDENKPIQAGYRIRLYRVIPQDVSKKLTKVITLPCPPFPGLDIHFGNVHSFILKEIHYLEGEDCLYATDYRGHPITIETVADIVIRYQSYGWELVD